MWLLLIRGGAEGGFTVDEFILVPVKDAAGIAEGLRAGAPEVLAAWQRERGAGGGEAGLLEGVGRLLEAFAEFLLDPEPVEGFSRQGATRALVARISASQHELGRDAVGVMEDYAALRRCVWRFVEGNTDLSALDGGEVARFFVKLLQAADWATERGLSEFEGIVRRQMEGELGRAAATDLLTGLPDRELFNRWLLPRAVKEHERFALVVFDLAAFSEMVAAGGVPRARGALLGLAGTVERRVPEGATRVRFGDDEICVLLPDAGPERAYEVAEAVLEDLARSPEGLRADAGIAGYPEHGSDPGDLIVSVAWALKAAKRIGGGGIVVAR